MIIKTTQINSSYYRHSKRWWICVWM